MHESTADSSSARSDIWIFWWKKKWENISFRVEFSVHPALLARLNHEYKRLLSKALTRSNLTVLTLFCYLFTYPVFLTVVWAENPVHKGRTRTYFSHLSYKTPLNCLDFPSLNILYADLLPWQLKGNKNNKAKYSPWMSLIIGHMDLFRWKISLLEADARGYGLSLVTVMPWHPLVPGNATLHYVSEATLELEPYVPQCLRGGRFLIILFGFHSSCPGLWEVCCFSGDVWVCIKP